MAELKKTLGIGMIAAITFVSLVYPDLTYNIMVGATHNGAASIVAWIILAIASVFTAMYIGELISMFPSAGGIYEFYKQAFGRFPSFLVGWITWIAGNIFTALYSVAAVEYIIPPDYSVLLGPWVIHATIVKIAVTIVFIMFINYIAFRGIDASARVMLFLAIIGVFLSIALLYPGVMFAQATHFFPLTVAASSLLITMFFLSETFFGWDSVASLAEETKNAERVIPRVLVAVTAIVAIINILTAFTVMGVIGAKDPSAITTTNFLGLLHASPLLLLIINASVFLLLLGSTSGNAIGLPRLLLALGRDKLFIEQFGDIHEKYQTPYKAIIFQTITTSLIVIFGQGQWDNLFKLFVPLNLAIYAGLLILVPYFRWKKKDHPRAYRAPFGRTMPYLIAALNIGMIAAWAITDKRAIADIRILASFIFFSIPIYLLLAYFYDPDSLIGTISRFARLNLWLENILIPKRIRREVIEFFTNAKDKHVLEFGSGVGTLTIHLANHVGKGGHVYAVDLSKSNVDILQKRMNKLGHTHVEVIHDPHLVNRVHPNVKAVDIIVSINNLGYIQDIKKVLREMNVLLPQNGRVCFVEYIDLFYFLPNPKWLSDPELVKKAFSDAGFTVQVRIRRGIFWKYMYIYGIKDSRNVPYI